MFRLIITGVAREYDPGRFATGTLLSGRPTSSIPSCSRWARAFPPERFRAYLLQNYNFVKDLVSITAMGIAKAPDLAAADRLSSFLGGILTPDDYFFVRAFKELGFG